MSRMVLARRQMLTKLCSAALGLQGIVLLAACGGTTAKQTSSSTTVPPTARGTSTIASSTAAPTSSAAAVGATPAPASGAAAKTKGTVTWLVRTGLAENDGQKAVFLPAAAKMLPDVKIEYINVPGPQYIEKIFSMAAGGAPPDVWGFGGNYFDYWAKGLPQALDQYIGADKWDVDNYFLPGLMDIYKVHGHHYGLSQLTTFGNLGFYNKEMFVQSGVTPPPFDWSDTSWNVDTMLAAAHRLTKNPGQPDAVYGVDWGISQPYSLAYLWGDDPWRPEHYRDYIAKESQLDNPGVIDSYQFKQDLLWKDHVMANVNDMKALGHLPHGMFQDQRVAMTFSGGWNFWGFNTIKDFTVGICAVPGKKTNKVNNFDDFWIMARASQNKDSAWAFMRMLTNADVAADYGLHTGTPVTPRAAYEKWLPAQAARKKISVEDLKKVTLGAIEPKRSQESPDHLFLAHPQIVKAFNDGMQDVYVGHKGAVSGLMPSIKSAVDGVVRSIYDRYNGKLPKD